MLRLPEAACRLPFVRGDEALKLLSSAHIAAEDHRAHRAFIARRKPQFERVARLPQPQLGSVNGMPVRCLSGAQQEDDRGAARAAIGACVPAPGLAIPPSLGMRGEAQLFD